MTSSETNQELHLTTAGLAGSEVQAPSADALTRELYQKGRWRQQASPAWTADEGADPSSAEGSASDAI